MAEIIRGMSREEYDKVARLNWSRLRLMAKSPAHYHHGGSKDTDALRLGALAHMLVLERERAESHYVVDDRNRNSNDFKAMRAAMEEQGKEVIKSDEWREALAIAEAVRSHDLASQLLSHGSAEATCLWEMSGEGYHFDCKARLDYLGPMGIVELKTGRDVSLKWFQKQMMSLNYPGQFAYQARGVSAAMGGPSHPYWVVAVESSAPHVVQVFEVTDGLMEYGWNLCARLLGQLAECTARNEWPAYSTGPLKLELPTWALAPDEDEEEAAA